MTTSPGKLREADWLTVAAMAALVGTMTLGIHESVHAITCTFVGRLEALSSHFAKCASSTPGAAKLVSMSASLSNIVLACVALFWLRRAKGASRAWTYFLWLFMTMNFMSGAGYWFFSGVFGVGDWAEVIQGWQPHWLWRSVMAVFGGVAVTFLLWIALTELGRIVGDGAPSRRSSRVTRLAWTSYLAATVASTAAAVLNPNGFNPRHVVMGAMYPSPLLWMMLWFRSKAFAKLSGPALAFGRHWGWIMLSAVFVGVYVFVLGRTLSF